MKVLLILLLLVMGAAFLLWQMMPTLAQSNTCAAENPIVETLESGARWELCWEVRNQEGIVLHEIYYTTPSGLRRKILKQANLAQIHVAYDDGERAHLLTEYGLGNERLVPLTSEECLDGTLLSDGVNTDRAILCKQISRYGYLYKYFDQQRQGTALNLYSVSIINEQTYIVQWRFLDDGTIEPSIGLSGQLARMGTEPLYGWPLDAGKQKIGIGYVNNYYWRLDFDIGGLDAGEEAAGPIGDVVEEFEVEPATNNTRRVLTVTPLSEETARPIEPAKKRSWRIRSGSINNADGHPVSIHLEPLHAGHRYIGPSNEPWSQNDFFVTVNHPCEQFLSQNSQTDGCGEHVAEFVNGESLERADLVVWYGLTVHHLPRDEDEPFINTRWNGFQLLLRDWTAQNQF
ncbi:hypothetical protein KFU94_18650 [Chloroflexi bacterium TSY]|nr:hypothetical protein [Chloroflexi bacterium TSY]